MPKYYTLAIPETALSIIRFGHFPESLPEWVTMNSGRKINFFSTPKDCVAKLTRTLHQAFIFQVELPESYLISQVSDIIQADHFDPAWIESIYVYSLRGKKTLLAILNNKLNIEIQISPELYPFVAIEKKNNKEELYSQNKAIKEPSPNLIHIKQGDLLRSQMQTLINTVNCVGVMGKGIAYAFKQEYPAMFKDYKEKCNKKLVQLGKPYLYKVNKDKWIINFPTKGHWKSDSNLEDVENGLIYLAKQLPLWGVTSLAIPPLGCGNGNLNWDDVFPLVKKYLYPLNIQLDIYAPFKEPKIVSSKKSHLKEKKPVASSLKKSKLAKKKTSYQDHEEKKKENRSSTDFMMEDLGGKRLNSQPLISDFSKSVKKSRSSNDKTPSFYPKELTSTSSSSSSASFSSSLSFSYPEQDKRILEDQGVLALIRDARNRLFSLGSSISEEDRGRFLREFAFYEKLAQYAQLKAKDRKKLDEIIGDFEIAYAEQLSINSAIVESGL